MTNIFGIYSAASLMTIFLFFGFYIEPKIIAKIDEFSSLAKYGVLQARSLYPKLGWACAISAIAFAFSWSLAYSFRIIPEALYQSTRVLFALFPNFLLMFGLFNFVFITFMDAKKEVELSFSVITDYENVANESNKVLYQNRPIVYPCHVWNLCIKQIVYKLEDLLKRRVGFSGEIGSEFYEIFNTVSLAALIGNPEQQEKAKVWIAELGQIVIQKGASVTTKNESIIEHLEKGQNEESFRNLKTMKETFGFHYDFEHGRSKLRKTWKWMLRAVVGLGSIIGLVQLIRAILNI